jgi:YebC/PmpR family DNA-binding regulatory protein
MAGHSKWANIKRRKGAQDAVRGKLFTKLIKEIMVAAKMGGSDADANPRLRLAIDKAKAKSMPRHTIERAVSKGAGELQGDDFENLVYEGYGPGGVAVLVDCLTDNRNRTASDVRAAFARGGGNLGASGSVSYMFTTKGVFTLPKETGDEDDIMMAALEAGADDVLDDDDVWTVTSGFSEYEACKKGLFELAGEALTAELTKIPETTVAVELDDAKKLMGLLERLEDCDDVQETHTNADFSDEVGAQL